MLPLRVRYVINPIVPRPQSLDVSVKKKLSTVHLVFFHEQSISNEM